MNWFTVKYRLLSKRFGFFAALKFLVAGDSAMSRLAVPSLELSLDLRICEYWNICTRGSAFLVLFLWRLQFCK